MVLAAIEIDVTTLVLILTIVSGGVAGFGKLIDIIATLIKERRQNGTSKTKSKKRDTGDLTKELKDIQDKIKNLQTEEQREQLKRIDALVTEVLTVKSGQVTCHETLLKESAALQARVKELETSRNDLQTQWREELREMIREMSEFSKRFDRGMDHHDVGGSGVYPAASDSDGEQ